MSRANGAPHKINHGNGPPHQVNPGNSKQVIPADKSTVHGNTTTMNPVASKSKPTLIAKIGTDKQNTIMTTENNLE